MSQLSSAKLNQPAPDFVLPSSTGELVRLSDFKDKQSVVLYFYPQDNTPFCTAESCAFRDNHDLFRAKGAVVIGISADSISSHQHFASKHDLPFILLSDEGNRVRSAWKVPSTFGLWPGRVSYIIDEKGIIRGIYDSQLNPLGHIKYALSILPG